MYQRTTLIPCTMSKYQINSQTRTHLERFISQNDPTGNQSRNLLIQHLHANCWTTEVVKSLRSGTQYKAAYNYVGDKSPCTYVHKRMSTVMNMISNENSHTKAKFLCLYSHQFWQGIQYNESTIRQVGEILNSPRSFYISTFRRGKCQ